MAEDGSRLGSFLRGFMIGGFLGVMAGFLFAPKPGKELRSELREKGEEAFGEARHLYSDACRRAKSILEEARLKTREVLNEAEERASAVIREARAEAEKAEEAMPSGDEGPEHGSSDK